jgi:hypothetical protein
MFGSCDVSRFCISVSEYGTVFGLIAICVAYPTVKALYVINSLRLEREYGQSCADRL